MFGGNQAGDSVEAFERLTGCLTIFDRWQLSNPIVISPAVPTAPSSLRCHLPTVSPGTGDIEATVDWAAPADSGGADMLYYQLECADAEDNSPFTTVYTGRQTQHTRRLRRGRTYKMRVRAYNEVGDSGYSLITTVSTPPVLGSGQDERLIIAKEGQLLTSVPASSPRASFRGSFPLATDVSVMLRRRSCACSYTLTGC